MLSDDAASLRQQLDHFLTSKQWARGSEVAGQLLTREPDSALLHHQLGYTYFQLGQLEAAEKHLKQAISLEPEMDVAFQTLAYTYWKMGRLGIAEDHARVAVSLDPDDEENWILSAYLCLQFDDSKQALFCIEKAAAIQPEDERLIDLRALVGAIDEGEEKLSPEEQIAAYELLLSKNPEDDYAHSKLGEIYFNELKNPAKAEEHFRQALFLDPADQANQTRLIHFLRQRDPMLRILWAPFDFGMWILGLCETAWRLKWPLIILFFCAKFLIIGIAALFLVFFTLFWPMAKIYEWLTLAEIHKKMGKITLYRGPFARIHHLPFSFRWGIFITIIISFWSFIAWIWNKQHNQNVFVEWIALLCSGGATLLILTSWSLMLRDWWRKKRRDKKNKILHDPETTP